VIGTVIDPEMGDSIRVTVVATGLGQPVAKQQQLHMRMVAPAVVQRGHMPAASHAAASQSVDSAGYGAYDQPTFMRQRAVGDQLTDGGDASFDLLDVPAFLRRQAD
jgi:cell division protein FtsZ